MLQLPPFRYQTPNAALYGTAAVLPANLDLDFTTTTTLDPRVTFSRTSLATYYAADGLLKYAAHNYMWWSEDFSSSAYTKTAGATVTADAAMAPNGTTTADRLNHVTAGTVVGGYVSQIMLAGGSTCPLIYSVYAKAGSKNWLALGNNSSGVQHCWFNLATGVVGTRNANWVSSDIENVGNGWYRCWGRVDLLTATVMNIRVAEADNTLNCTSPGDIYIWGAQAEYVTTETVPRAYMSTIGAERHAPRFDYDPVTHAANGLLIEEARTNYALDTQDFSFWTATGATVTTNQSVAPDGTTTAERMTSSATVATVNRNVSSSVADLTSYVVSLYIKRGTSDWVYLAGHVTGTGAGTPKAYFNLATGAVGTIESPLTAAAIQSVGNGWYRCSVTRLGTAGLEHLLVGICDGDNSNVVTIGRTTFIWGAQIELGAFPTSYIPTVNGALVRAADVATMTGTNFSSWYNQSAGTFVAEFDLLAASGTRGILAADNNTTAEMIRLYGSGTDPKVTITDNSVTQADLDVGTIAANTAYKLGVSYALNDIAACINGGTVGTDTVATLPTPTQLRIGTESATAANILDGHVRRIQFFNTRQSNAALQVLTT